MKIIPIFKPASFTETLTLDNSEYVFKVNWNARGEHFTLSVYDTDNNLLVGGIKIVLGIELFGNYPDRGLPPGALFVSDLTNSDKPIERNDFTNGRLNLIYIEAENG